MSVSSASRRQWLYRWAGLAALSGLPASATAQLSEPDELLRIAVGARGTLYHLPLLAAQELGFFADEGLKVQIDDHPSGAAAVQALATGRADVCCGGYEHVMRGQLHGQDWRSLVLLARAPQIALLTSAKLQRNEDLARLRPLRVGVTAPGSSTHYLASLWLQQAGLDEHPVQFVAVGSGAAAVEALRHGRVHALCHADPVLTLLEQRTSVRVLADTRSLKGSAQMYGGTMPGGCLFAPQYFVQRRPRQTQALANAMVRALRWLQTASVTDLARLVPKPYLLGDRGAYLAAFEKVRETLSPDGTMPADGPATALRAVQRMQPMALAQTRVLLEKTYSDTWARKAREKIERV
ncbi:NitT/TauT family transport system substrate-binding protein [Oryzisolibacter propanilivorax]|uniref:NitT/TauT family transport system substrate-binding protein n=1 Tax=Oryzisolibacter propanilivorax TaxID=1527607 RepID=A0A1G9PPA3_9BURK|nr:ABC transporter substrate-binding protein [Oryzisolibacter propanilivorax]SDM00443.1 NitT/TauT family transport system substrate-binding protein [Oryzisolibacter propanilivorax]